jgi:PelA/Pel-15E family pectate lyase
MIGIMNFLKDILDNKPYYSFLNNTYKEKTNIAFQKGLACILKCQIKEKGVLTAWCQQHHEKTLKPVWARAFEPPSISNQESANIVLFLMKLKNPNKDIIRAIQGAIQWFNNSKIYNTRVDIIKVPTVQFKLNKSSIDRVVVVDSTAPPIWTRYYELKTHRPLFCDRNGKFLYSLAEVSHERRSGYGWYTYEPQQALDKYSKWKKKYNP